MLDKYCVVTKKGYSVSDIDLELISDGGSQTIPERKVDIAEAHPNTQRTTVFYLTDEEASQIANDPRVLSVELHPESNPNVKIDKLAVDVRDYARDGQNSNWGLKRHSTNQMNFYNANRTVNTSQTSNSYTYNNAGEGVDIMVIDQGIQADHPDFLDENGVSRVQQIDWTPFIEGAGYSISDSIAEQLKAKNYYKEQANHGTDVASIAAGNRFGWAKKAHIYSCKWEYYYESEGQYYNRPLLAPERWIDIVTYWHKNKKNNRPTIINLSVGYVVGSFSLSNVIGGSYADANNERASWVRGDLTNEQISETYKVRTPVDGLPVHFSYIRSFVEEAIDTGIHVVASAANSGTRSVRLDNPEIDNTVTVQDGNDVRVIKYNHPSSFYAEDESILVGATDNYIVSHAEDEYKEQLATFSTRGEALHIFAAGEACLSATSKDAINPRTRSFYGEHGSDNFASQFLGTSCSSPQVAGALALYASEYPNYSPAQLRSLLLDEASTDQIYSDTTSYSNVRNALDSPNKLLYSRFNNDIGFTLNNVSSTNINLGQQYKFSTIFTRDSNIFANYTGINALNTDGNAGEFHNNDFSAIYPNTKIVSMYAQNLGVDTSTDLLEYLITLKFDGASVYNGGWSTMEIANKQANMYVKLQRKDAVFNPVKQEFVWNHSDDNTILRSTIENNRIGFW